jgi:hypothetical protein
MPGNARHVAGNACCDPSFPGSAVAFVTKSGIFGGGWNSPNWRASPIREPSATLECPHRIDIPHIAVAETFPMTLTVAHISPIISVLAGVLILIMPRLLNLIVAVFLIVNGLIGLGLLRWLHI